MKKKAIFNWSGGKDSSLCLHKILTEKEYEISCLLTSVNEEYQRISQHGVRAELLEQQADSIGLPLQKLIMPNMPDMDTYNQLMETTLKKYKKEDVSFSIFGDIFLEDLREYREKRLEMLEMKGVFPLWKISTEKLAKEFIDLGFKAIIVCTNDRFLDKSFVGRELDNDFLKSLPESVDPCGEYGEFHSFVYDGPIFNKPVKFSKGELVHRKYTPPQKKEDDDSYTCGSSSDRPHVSAGFWFCDLVPVD